MSDDRLCCDGFYLRIIFHYSMDMAHLSLTVAKNHVR